MVFFFLIFLLTQYMFTVKFLWNVLYITDSTLTSPIFIWGIIRVNNFKIRLVFDECEIYQLRFIVPAFFISLAYMFCASYNISESPFHGFMLFTLA